MLGALLAVSQPVRGHEPAALNYFAFFVAIAGIVLWIVAASYRVRRGS